MKENKLIILKLPKKKAPGSDYFFENSTKHLKRELTPTLHNLF
jgi:hypothetical protein